jgi:hypothetical protein
VDALIYGSENVFGSSGFIVDFEHNQPEDEDEIKVSPPKPVTCLKTCHAVADCVADADHESYGDEALDFIPGKCQCKPNYWGNGLDYCVDQSLCVDTCSENAKCVNINVDYSVYDLLSNEEAVDENEDDSIYGYGSYGSYGSLDDEDDEVEEIYYNLGSSDDFGSFGSLGSYGSNSKGSLGSDINNVGNLLQQHHEAFLSGDVDDPVQSITINFNRRLDEDEEDQQPIINYPAVYQCRCDPGYTGN